MIARASHVRATIALAGVLTVLGVLSPVVARWDGPGPAGASTAPSGCGGSSRGSTTLTPTVDGFKRTVLVHVPTSFTNQAALALVLNLHGSGATALEQEEFSGMDESANHDDFIVAYPQAIIRDGTGYDWNLPGEPLIGGRAVPPGSANDLKFLASLVAILEHDYCIDPSMVYATGFSGGAREVSQLACDDSTIFAAVAPVSGLRHPTPCPATRAVPVIAFHGSADPVDPFDGNGQAYWTYSVPSAAKEWASQDHCGATAHVKTSIAGVVLSSYRHCAGGAEVELYEVLGEGHEWPGGPAMPAGLTAVLGPQSSAVTANSLMWSFFRAHRL